MNGDHLALLLGGGDGIVSDITRNGSGGACLVLLLVSLLAVGRGLAGSRGGGLGASLAVRRCEDGREENNEEDKEEKEREEKKEEEDDEEEGGNENEEEEEEEEEEEAFRWDQGR